MRKTVILRINGTINNIQTLHFTPFSNFYGTKIFSDNPSSVVHQNEIIGQSLMRLNAWTCARTHAKHTFFHIEDAFFVSSLSSLSFNSSPPTNVCSFWMRNEKRDLLRYCVLRMSRPSSPYWNCWTNRVRVSNFQTDACAKWASIGISKWTKICACTRLARCCSASLRVNIFRKKCKHLQ